MTAVGQQTISLAAIDLAAFEQWMGDRGLSEASIYKRLTRVRTFTEWIEPRSILDTLAEDVTAFLDELGLSKDSRRGYRAELAHFFDFTEARGLTGAPNPARSVPPTPSVAPEPAGAFGYRRHLERRALVPMTIDKALEFLGAFARWLEPATLIEASGEDIERFLDERVGRDGGRISASSRSQWIGTLRGFYRWALLEERVAKDPTLRVVAPKQRQYLPRPIADADLRRALAHAEANDPAMHVMLTLGAFEGLRCVEISRLVVADVDVDETLGAVRVIGKGNKERVVPLHPEVARAVALMERPRGGTVLPPFAGRAWTARKVSNRIGWFLDSLGIDATAHQLRHWFATKTYAATRDLLLVQKLMGHAMPSTTARYALVVPGPEAVAAVQSLGWTA